MKVSYLDICQLLHTRIIHVITVESKRFPFLNIGMTVIRVGPHLPFLIRRKTQLDLLVALEERPFGACLRSAEVEDAGRDALLQEED